MAESSLRQVVATAFFIQRSRLGKRVYELRDSKLTISGKFGFKKCTREFNMHYISPDIVRAKRRMARLVQIPLALACLAGLVLRVFRFVPWGIYIFVVEVCGVIGIMSLWQAIRGIAPVEVVVFKNTNNFVQFDVVKEAKQGAEFEEFIEALLNSISAEKNSTRSAFLRPTPGTETALASPSYYWIGSIALGTLSNGLPLF